ncbi:MAG: VanZ family protein [Bacteroidia bacterium]|jgi:VanZ family protein
MKLNRAYILAILWTLFIASSCLLPPSAFRSFSFNTLLGLDKIVHFVLYAIFILLWALAFRYISLKQKIALLLMGITYGVLIEVLQSTMAIGRNYDIGDIVSNIIGCVTGVILISFVQRTAPLLKKYLPFLNKLY